jgi:peptide/nickel transport system permease protein
MSAQAPGSVAATPARKPRGPAARYMLIGGGMLVVLALVALAAPLIAPHDPETVEASRVLGAPDLTHWFGSDVLGRDVLSRVIYALRVSLLVAIAAVAASLAIAVPLGLLAGYFGSWVDTSISRTVDMILVLPAMLLAITFIAILGPGSVVATLAIAVIYLPILARVMRTSTLVVTRNDYVAGSRARGASHWRVMLQHVAPNALGPVIVQASVLCAFALQLEAGLSFLGLGVQPPTPSLGGMLADGRDVLNQAPWVEIFPGLAIVMMVLAFSFLGEGLRRAFDPQGVSG